jgi:hypothetical protein
MARKTKVDRLDKDEKDDNGFSEGDVVTDKVVSTFNYFTTPAAPDPSSPSSAPAPNTATPGVEGEAYTIGRYYKLRYSTAKMLNEIKASNPDVNVYMNTLVDEAIRYYYSYGFKNERN